jgi:cell division protein FtsZ
MTPNPPPSPGPASRNVSIKTFGIGATGIRVIEQLIQDRPSGMSFVAVDTDSHSLAGSSAPHQAQLESKNLRGLGTGADPERGAAAAREHLASLRTLCEGSDIIFLVLGLGGGAGTGIAPVLASAAKEVGALVLAFVTTPFACEGGRRGQLASEGLSELKAAADGVVCLPNQKLFKLIDENTSVLDTFGFTAGLMADAVRAVWRLLAHGGLIEIHFDDLCRLLRDRHAESCFAVAEAIGPTRSCEVADRLLAHPMLDGGKDLKTAESVLVSLTGGPELTMVEVNRVIDQIRQQCQHAQLIMGAAIDPTFADRLTVTLIAAKKEQPTIEAPPRSAAQPEELNHQLLASNSGVRPQSRFVPPPPALAPEKIHQLMNRQGAASVRPKKISAKLQQTQLPLEIVSKGRFDKSEPTIYKGEDLDVPTYIRRGVPLN